MKTPPIRQASQDEIYSHVRMRVAFEQMVLSVLYGAFLTAGIVLFVRTIATLFSTGFGVAAILSVVFATITYAFIVFLAGFLSVVIVGVPLFQLLEARKIRKAWPFFAAAFFVELVFCVLALGGVPDFVRLPVATSISLIAPGFVVAALFVRRMQPYWRRAENTNPAPPAVIRLH